LAILARRAADRKDGLLHMLDQMRHAAAALRTLAATAENLARRHHAKFISLHQAADGFLDVLGGDDVALTDDHGCEPPMKIISEIRPIVIPAKAGTP
jgi:hypothetical protein